MKSTDHCIEIKTNLNVEDMMHEVLRSCSLQYIYCCERVWPMRLHVTVNVPPWPKTITWFNKAGTVEGGGRYHIIEDGLGAYSVEVGKKTVFTILKYSMLILLLLSIKDVIIQSSSVSVVSNRNGKLLWISCLILTMFLQNCKFNEGVALSSPPHSLN